MHIEHLQRDQIADVVRLEKTVWGNQAATGEQVLSRLDSCPEGSMVAVLDDGSIGGYAAAQRVNSISAGTWAEQTDNGMIQSTHRPKGQIAYGVTMSALPSASNQGISGAIIASYARIFVHEGGCSLMCLGSRLPGYRKWVEKSGGSAREYISQRRFNRPIDPELYIYERAGFKVLWELPNYFPDQRSSDYGVMIAMNWLDSQQVLLAAA